MRYIVELYNKDGDNYHTEYKTDDLSIAKEVCKVVDTLCCKDLIIDRESVYTEPFDWAEVYDTDENVADVVFLPR